MRLLKALLVTAAASLLLAGVAAADQAEQLRPIDLRVFGGEDGWHADNDFRLDWDQPPVAASGYPVAAVHYRVRNAAGAVVLAEAVVDWGTTQIEHLHVPSGPGIYTAEVWLEGPDGRRGPSVSATLRFDDARPGPAQPASPAAWFAGNVAAAVKIGRPAGPQPVSGIRGYAVSVDRGGGSAPCAGTDRCGLTETDLRGGIDADTLSLGLLPEGVNVVRVVAVSGSGMRSAEPRSTIVRVDATPPQVALRGRPTGWADGPVRLTATAADAMSGIAPSGPNGPFTAIAVDGAVPRVEPGGSATAVVSGEGVHDIAFYARDAAGNVGETTAQATVQIDRTPPRIAFAASQDPAEPERIEATVNDSLAGPDSARGSIAVRPAGSRQPFRQLPTTVSGNRLVARWDSDASAPGTYEFRGTAYDRAGNVGSSDRRRNGTRMVLVNPLKAPTQISAGFSGRRPVRPATRTVPYGRTVIYSGRLTSASQAPLAGLPIRVVESFDAGAEPDQRTTTVRSAADGTFRVRLAAGPSRGVEAVFGGDRTRARASGGQVRLGVLGGLRMHASSASARIGGAPVVFSGRVEALGAPIPAGGRAVELQFRFRGSDWSEFRTVQTDARGRFRYPYSFSDDDSRGVRFQFRAFAAAEDGWPYEPAFSRPVFVTGR